MPWEEGCFHGYLTCSCSLPPAGKDLVGVQNLLKKHHTLAVSL